MESIDAGNNSTVGNLNGLGTGPVTFYDGTLQFFGYNGSTTPEYSGNNCPLIVPAGQSGSLLLASRITRPGLTGTVSGGGTMNLVVNYVRANPDSGSTTISNGVLALKDEGSANSLAINIVSNAVLEVSERVDGTWLPPASLTAAAISASRCRSIPSRCGGFTRSRCSRI